MELKEGNAPTGVMPKSLLTPPALYATARQLYTSTEIRDPNTSGAKYGTANIFANRYQPLVSAYIGSGSGISGGSDTAWYLLADPNDLPVMVVSFLDGKEAPTVESSDVDFSVLGIQFRGYYDFGCSKAEWLAGVKCTA